MTMRIIGTSEQICTLISILENVLSQNNIFWCFTNDHVSFLLNRPCRFMHVSYYHAGVWHRFHGTSCVRVFFLCMCFVCIHTRTSHTYVFLSCSYSQVSPCEIRLTLPTNWVRMPRINTRTYCVVIMYIDEKRNFSIVVNHLYYCRREIVSES